MSFKVVCPFCQNTIKAPDKAAGKTAHCPKCQNAIKLPALKSAPAAPPPQQQMMAPVPQYQQGVSEPQQMNVYVQGQTPKPPGSGLVLGMGIPSLVLGIVSILFGCFFGCLGVFALPVPLIGVVMGIIGIAAAARAKGGSGLPIAGTITSVIGTVIVAIPAIIGTAFIAMIFGAAHTANINSQQMKDKFTNKGNDQIPGKTDGGKKDFDNNGGNKDVGNNGGNKDSDNKGGKKDTGNDKKNPKITQPPLGLQIGNISGNKRRIRNLAFHPKGALVACYDGLPLGVGNEGSDIRLFDLKKQTAVLSWECAADASLVFAPNRDVVLANSGISLSLWNPFNGKQYGKTLTARIGGSYSRSAIFSPDGKRIAVSNDNGTVRIILVFKNGALYRKIDEGASVNSVAFSQDGRLLVTGNDNRSVRLYDIEQNRQVRVFEGHTGQVYRVAFSVDGQKIVSCARDGKTNSINDTLHVWDKNDGKIITKLNYGRGQAVTSVDLDLNKQRLLVGHSSGKLELWDLTEEKVIMRFPGHKGAVTSLAIAPNGRIAASGGMDNILRIWQLPG